MGGGFRRSGFAGKPHESVLGAEKTVALGTGLARERRLLITGEPPKQAEDRKKPNPSACTGLAEHLLPRRHGLIQSFPKEEKGNCQRFHHAPPAASVRARSSQSRGQILGTGDKSPLHSLTVIYDMSSRL